jgi:uncharacterized protein
MSIYQIFGIIILGVLAGTLSSMVGIGGGIVIVPALVMGFGLSQHSAQGTTLAMLSFPVALASVINYHKAGKVEWEIALLLCLGFIFGSYFGSKFALSIDAKMIKKVFAILLIIIAFKMLWETKK